MMELELDGTKFDELCDHAEDLEAEVMRLEKRLRILNEAINKAKAEANTMFQVTNNLHYHHIYQMLHFAQQEAL